MRQLTVSQKKILDIQSKNGISCWDDLSMKVINQLETINDTEILYQEVNRYLNDSYWKNKNKKSGLDFINF